MNDRTQSHDERTDFKRLDGHGGRRGVYSLLAAAEGQTHARDEQRDDGPVDLDVAEPPRDNDELLTEVLL